MKNERFKIFVEQLRDGHSEKIAECFSPEFLDVHEKDLAFTDSVDVAGEAYLADDTLILHVDVKTSAIISCRICNGPVKVPIEIIGFYHAVPLNEIKGGIFSFEEILRETILLETPSLAECAQGKCPQRQTMQKYFKKEDTTGTQQQGSQGYQPFADFDFDQTKHKIN